MKSEDRNSKLETRNYVASREGLVKRWRRWIVGAVVATMIAAVLLNMPPFTECEQNSPVSDYQYWFSPAEIVVQPWRGRHHVYGDFTVPERYKFDHLYTAKLVILGAAAELQAGSAEDEIPNSGRSEPGYYTKRVYVSTRTALWFWL
ncbi:MAG: hypothetical protein OEY86_20450, partial [Nitrospira sp.]|nr:hypothetical protein [Nitrospira sp.]